MNNFITIPVDEGISFKIPATWVKEVGALGEYAFISNDGTIFLTATFIGLDKSDTTPLRKMLEESTTGIKEIADFTAPLLETPRSVAQHLEVYKQNILFAIVEGTTDDRRVIANLFFKTEDAAVFEKNQALMEEMIQAVEINR